MTKNAWAVQGSLVDLVNGSVPTFARSSPMTIEQIVDGSIRHYPVKSHAPAFMLDDASIVLEPAGANLCTHSINLTNSSWQKGSQLFVRPDYAPAPDTSYRADQLSWVSGSGASQVLRRRFVLDAGQEYVLQVFLRPKGGFFTNDDVLRVVGGVAGTPKISLSSLNDATGVYKALQLKFTVAGKQPVLTATAHNTGGYSIAQVNTNTLTLVVPSGTEVNTNDFQGGLIVTPQGTYNITGNSSIVSGQIVVNTQQATLISDGVVINGKASITRPEGVDVDVEFYVESTAAVDWGGFDLKRGNFFTSPIYQGDAIQPRADTFLEWRQSPFSNLKTFGFYGEIRSWAGDGGLFDAGNFTGEINAGKLVIKVGGTVLTVPDSLPASFRFFVQVQEQTGFATVYINGKLKAKGGVSNFRAQSLTPFRLPSDAARTWKLLLLRELPTLEGQPALGENAQEEVLEMFTGAVLIESREIASHAPVVQLPSVTIPAKAAPTAFSTVQGVATNSAGTSVTVSENAGFLPNQTVDIVRSGQKVGSAFVLSYTLTSLQLSGNAGIIVGDTLTFRTVQNSGRASVRFPADPIDPLKITAIDTINNRVTVASALTFNPAKAFIRNDSYEDILEVVVQSVDTVASQLRLNTVATLQVGQTIYQPLNELMIEPGNYIPDINEDAPGIKVGECWKNGIVLYNENPFPVTVTPFLRVYL